MEKKVPRIGIAAIVRNEDGKVLLGLRTSKHAHGTWGFPGGHLEFNETPEDCVRREVEEETGLIVSSIQKADYTNDFYPDEDKHYITLFFEVTCTQETPEIKEPDKCERWEWFEAGNLPEPLMSPIISLLAEKKTLEYGKDR